VMRGQAGDDRLIGQGGKDTAIGGAGRDICRAEKKKSCP
jgi:Ca2+-binding RTX toxin-like protein